MSKSINFRDLSKENSKIINILLHFPIILFAIVLSPWKLALRKFASLGGNSVAKHWIANFVMVFI